MNENFKIRLRELKTDFIYAEETSRFAAYFNKGGSRKKRKKKESIVSMMYAENNCGKINILEELKMLGRPTHM